VTADQSASIVAVQACFDAAGYDWSRLGLPLPNWDGYGYRVDAGLIRTPMDSGHVRQRRRWTHRPHTFSLTWRVRADELQVISEVLDQHGYSGLWIPLVTGLYGLREPLPHLVRVISDIEVRAGSGLLFDVSAQVEMQSTPEIECLMAAMCPRYRACLDGDGFTAVSVDNWSALAAAWGDDEVWGRDN
jgi:hypothetical protein